MKQKALMTKVKQVLKNENDLYQIVSPLLLSKINRTAAQLHALRNMMKSCSMFMEVAEDPIVQLEICKCMTLEVFAEKEEIIREGEAGDCAYVLLRGSINIFFRTAKDAAVQEARKRPVWSFGDVALKCDAP